MTVRGAILVMLAAGMMAAASLMLRGGIDRIGGFGNETGGVVHDILKLLREPLFVIGALLYGTGTLVWMRVISTEPLSIGS